MFKDIVESISRLLTWWITVAPWEQAIRIRFGKHVRLLGPGIHFMIPFIDRAYQQTIRRRLNIIGPLTLTTTDNKTVILSGYLGYIVKDMLVLYNSIAQAQDTLDCEAMAHISQYVATHELKDCQPDLIQQAVLANVTKTLENYGLGEIEFFIANFASVKTYRFITGEVKSWMYESNGLNTQTYVGQKINP